MCVCDCLVTRELAVGVLLSGDLKFMRQLHEPDAEAQGRARRKGGAHAAASRLAPAAMSAVPPLDPLERAIGAAAARALRKRASLLRAKASTGVTVIDRGQRPPVLVVASKSATFLKIAKSWDAIAAELEAEKRP